MERDGRYLITQRRPVAILPLMWEFPGGRVEPGETDAAALTRDVRHRVGVGITVAKLISFVSHKYERYCVDLHLYSCGIAEGSPARLNVQAFDWVSSSDFDHYPFTPADEASVAALLGIQ
jgi:8-oxo-dGTP diphosphatase